MALALVFALAGSVVASGETGGGVGTSAETLEAAVDAGIELATKRFDAEVKANANDW